MSIGHRSWPFKIRRSDKAQYAPKSLTYTVRRRSIAHELYFSFIIIYHLITLCINTYISPFRTVLELLNEKMQQKAVFMIRNYVILIMVISNKPL